MNLTDLWSSLPEGIRNNQFFQGAGLLALIGVVVRLAWSWFIPLLKMLRNKCYLEISVCNDDDVFEWLRTWLDAQPSAKKIRNVLVSMQGRTDLPLPDDMKAPKRKKDTRPQLLVTPGYGTHVLTYKGRLLWLTRSREEGLKGESSMFSSMKTKERIKVIFLSRRRELISEFLNEVRDFALPPAEPMMHTYVWTNWNGWRVAQTRKRGEHRNVILPEGQLEDLQADVEKFRTDRDWYMARGIPWRRGYLLEGVPGSGKTSSVLELAIRTEQDLAVINLAGDWMDDNSILQAIAQKPADALLLFEDIDCIFNGRRDVEKKKGEDGVVSVKASKITLSGFLNAIDGVMTTEGTILFMSTNHSEKLDPALVRPGRVDRRINFTNATQDQAQRMFAHFFPGTNGKSETFARAIAGRELSMCKIQEHLVRHRDSPDVALLLADDLR